MNTRKMNTLLNLINIYTKYPYKAKYQFLINEREIIGLKHFNDAKAFVVYSNNMQDIYKNIGEYNSGKKRKILIVFDDMIADTINNKKLNSIMIKLFTRSRKLNIPLGFITQSYLKFQKMLD